MVKISVIATTVAMALGLVISAPAQAWERGGGTGEWYHSRSLHDGYRAPAAPPVYERHYRPQPHAYGPPPWRRRWAQWRHGYGPRHAYESPRGWW